jgi:hypothetical protein
MLASAHPYQLAKPASPQWKRICLPEPETSTALSSSLWIMRVFIEQHLEGKDFPFWAGLQWKKVT